MIEYLRRKEQAPRFETYEGVVGIASHLFMQEAARVTNIRLTVIAHPGESYTPKPVRDPDGREVRPGRSGALDDYHIAVGVTGKARDIAMFQTYCNVLQAMSMGEYVVPEELMPLIDKVDQARRHISARRQQVSQPLR